MHSLNTVISRSKRMRSGSAILLLALLLGAWMNGLPFFSRRVKMPEINRER